MTYDIQENIKMLPGLWEYISASCELEDTMKLTKYDFMHFPDNAATVEGLVSTDLVVQQSLPVPEPLKALLWIYAEDVTQDKLGSNGIYTELKEFKMKALWKYIVDAAGWWSFRRPATPEANAHNSACNKERILYGGADPILRHLRDLKVGIDKWKRNNKQEDAHITRWDDGAGEIGTIITTLASTNDITQQFQECKRVPGLWEYISASCELESLHDSEGNKEDLYMPEKYDRRTIDKIEEQTLDALISLKQTGSLPEPLPLILDFYIIKMSTFTKFSDEQNIRLRQPSDIYNDLNDNMFGLRTLWKYIVDAANVDQSVSDR
eukprot:GHVU01085745.1.p1 GENE.GHVU01085745.1~~GHVU01085745.1.p1  ORF type:complete len:359 (-),score=38.45 GHVU01085745.1:1684-2649(-)